MSLASVRAFLAEKAPDIEIIVLADSTATVALAAEAHQVEPARIAKTLTLKAGDRIVLLVARGDARLDNRKAKDAFGAKVRMLEPDVAAQVTGHPIGGVCPFGLTTDLPIYCDISLRAFEEVLPAAGAINAAIRIAPERLAGLVDAKWVDACQTVG